jgi:transcriptional regulator GlxA family with amidase domain
VPKVAAILYPEALASSVTLPTEILQAASQLARARQRRAPAPRMTLLQADSSGEVTLESGISLRTEGDLDTLGDCDLLLLPAIWRRPQRVLRRAQPWLPRLRELYAEGTTICSVGSAANLLAAAGLLDGRPATTHWHDFDAFAQRYPQVDLKRRHLITRSERLYCVGSVNSIADFMVHMVGQWYGEAVARSVQSQFSPEARQNFATASFLADAPEAHHDALIRDVQDHLREHFDEPQRLGELAARFELSPRNLSRRFRQATGKTLSGYLRDQRLREARSLLQHSDLAVAEIAWHCGFGSPSRFAQVFLSEQGMSPRSWRSAVRGKRFGSATPTPAGARP